MSTESKSGVTAASVGGEADGSVLLVGGAHDGEWIAKPRFPRIRLPVLRPVPAAWDAEEVMEEPYRIEEYEAHLFRVGERKWSLYILVGLPVEAAFDKLLAGYSPNAELRDRPESGGPQPQEGNELL